MMQLRAVLKWKTKQNKKKQCDWLQSAECCSPTTHPGVDAFTWPFPCTSHTMHGRANNQRIHKVKQSRGARRKCTCRLIKQWTQPSCFSFLSFFFKLLPLPCRWHSHRTQSQGWLFASTLHQPPTVAVIVWLIVTTQCVRVCTDAESDLPMEMKGPTVVNLPDVPACLPLKAITRSNLFIWM